MQNLTNFIKRHDYLVCVDSDGCAMDTMDVKHFHCFGPCMVDEWALDQWREAILNRWNEINLYTITRGINRFKGLAIALQEVSDTYTPIEGIDTLTFWAETAPELSNGALMHQIEATGAEILKKALSWSMAVNAAINALPEESKLPFPLAKEGLAHAHTMADVAIVSSANLDAVLEEWEKHGLLDHVDIVLSQNEGSKAFCISQMLKFGYDPKNVIMCGDAPGDLDAADKNGVFFYPILVKKERESWQEFIDTGCQKLTSHTYGGDYQAKKRAEFYTNLGVK